MVIGQPGLQHNKRVKQTRWLQYDQLYAVQPHLFLLMSRFWGCLFFKDMVILIIDIAELQNSELIYGLFFLICDVKKKKKHYTPFFYIQINHFNVYRFWK